MASKKSTASSWKRNPLLKINSSDKERITCKPRCLVAGKIVQFDTVIDWLKHLESENRPSGRKKTAREIMLDKATLSSFWDQVKRRAQIKALLKTGASESEIAKIMGVSKEAVNLWVAGIMPGRLTQKGNNLKTKAPEKKPIQSLDLTKFERKQRFSKPDYIMEVLQQSGLNFDALQQVYSRLELPKEGGGYLYARFTSEPKYSGKDIRSGYLLLAEDYPSKLLVLLEMDRLWGLYPERTLRSPDGVKNLAIRNLKEMGALR